ncbi:hypothetical protein PsYK624_171460 [Phanerochaete sordida]|uniref:Helicase C-terminal domain-containing protein n=1 Tax=Phanerochaete sordida TaxID=48140 RepID=A0A9P3LMH1_9APHY|nr:hypothetical protein PsYK624_171460 [Phanerochaete sordida]
MQGCNIHDINVVVQWKLPGTLSNFIQRAGHAARGSDRRGLAVLLVEPSVYPIILGETITGKQRRKRGKRRGKGKQAAAPPPRTKEESAESKAYARLHGGERGGIGRRDIVFAGVQTSLNLNADDEGLCTFVQTTQCRRKVWVEVFDGNPEHLRESHIAAP